MVHTHSFRSRLGHAVAAGAMLFTVARAANSTRAAGTSRSAEAPASATPASATPAPVTATRTAVLIGPPATSALAVPVERGSADFEAGSSAMPTLYFGAATSGATVSAMVKWDIGIVENQINRTGGYRFDGVNDCYGFVRRAWDPVLAHEGAAPLPIDDGPRSPAWAPINWNAMLPGDVLSTGQGHSWGPNWHGGIFGGRWNGVTYIWENSRWAGHSGVSLDPLPSSSYFSYYYSPTHQMLEVG
jgi:hypothetical protein